MREAIGGTWMFTIVIFFVMLFVGYLCLAINYSKAYNVKNGIVDVIERENGYTNNAVVEINDYLASVGYKTIGECDDGFIPGSTSNDNSQISMNNDNAYYCYREIDIPNSSEFDDKIEAKYYQVQVFFRIDLPIFRDTFTFRVTGDSKQIHFSNE